MKSRSALPGRPSWVGRGGPLETDRSQERHPEGASLLAGQITNGTPISSSLFVGDPSAGGGTGAVWVFDRSGSTWTEEAKIVPSDAIGASTFGLSILAGDNGVCIGGPEENGGDGAVWEYVSPVQWDPWIETLTMTSAVAGNFGSSLSFEGGLAVCWRGRPDCREF